MAGKGQNKIVWAMVLVVVVVLGLGVYAISGPMKEIVANKKQNELVEKIMTGQGTVSDMADVSGMSTEEYLANYNVEGITGDSTLEEFQNALSLEEYCTFMGITYTEDDFNAYKAQKELGDDVTLETKDKEVKDGFAQYINELQQAAEATEVPAEAETEAEITEAPAEATEAPAE